MISAHSDHRPQDIRFARTQSRGLSQLEWESRAPSLKSWGNYIAAAVACALLGLLALGWG